MDGETCVLGGQAKVVCRRVRHGGKRVARRQLLVHLFICPSSASHNSWLQRLHSRGGTRCSGAAGAGWSAGQPAGHGAAAAGGGGRGAGAGARARGRLRPGGVGPYLACRPCPQQAAPRRSPVLLFQLSLRSDPCCRRVPSPPLPSPPLPSSAARPSQVLPASPAATQQRLAAVQAELSELDVQQAAIGRRAAWRQHLLVWGGLGSQAALWALLFRLTFYELCVGGWAAGACPLGNVLQAAGLAASASRGPPRLPAAAHARALSVARRLRCRSWDVMEPICFFVGGAQAMVRAAQGSAQEGRGAVGQHRARAAGPAHGSPPPLHTRQQVLATTTARSSPPPPAARLFTQLPRIPPSPLHVVSSTCRRATVTLR